MCHGRGLGRGGAIGLGGKEAVFGNGDRNDEVRERLEHGGGQRAWAFIVDCKQRFQSGNFGVDPLKQVDHVRLMLRVEPENGAPFEATVRASFTHHRPRAGGSIGVIFDPGDHSKLAIYPQWAYTADSVGGPRTREMIAAFLGHQIPDAPSA